MRTLTHASLSLLLISSFLIPAAGWAQALDQVAFPGPASSLSATLAGDSEGGEERFITTPARQLPFLGTTQAEVIDGAGAQTVGAGVINLEGGLQTIARGDLNGDLAPDLLAGGNTLFAYDVKNGLYLWAVDESSVALASEITDIAILGDVNGDGTPDVVTIDAADPDGAIDTGSDGLTVWDGHDGSILWTANILSYRGQYYSHVPILAVADLDGDGQPDVATGGALGTVGGTSYGYDAIAAFDGQTGALIWQFRTPSDPNLLAVSAPQVVKAGDVDGDGKPEVAAGDQSSQVYCLNGEDGSERFVLKVPDANYVTSLALGDFTGDGKLEIAAGSSLYVTAYDGNGQQLWQFDEYAAGVNPSFWLDLESADFNRDGITDVAAVNYDRAWAVIEGGSGFSISNGGTAGPGIAVAAADITGDLYPELVFGDDNRSTVAVDVETGNYLWGHRPNGGAAVVEIEIANFNGIGRPWVASVQAAQDFIALIATAAPSNIWGRGFESFGYNRNNWNAQLSSATAGDLNGDGVTDTIVFDRKNLQLVSTNGKNGEILWSRFLPGGGSYLAAGDFDGDGKSEVVNYGAGTVYLVDGNGTPLGRIVEGANDSIVRVVDLSGDGRDEMVLGSIGQGARSFAYSGTPASLSLLWATADFGFKWNGSNSRNLRQGFAWGDIDDDGAAELLALGYNSADSLYGVYAIDPVTGILDTVVEGTNAWQSLAVGQLDLDTQMEVLLGHDGGVDAWDDVTNGGQFDFNYSGHPAQGNLAAADVDGDVSDEAVFAGTSAEGYVDAGVLEGDGSEKWYRDLAGDAGQYQNDNALLLDDMIVTDLDGDARPDIALGAAQGLNLLFLDGLTGVNLIDPVTIDGSGGVATMLAAGSFGPTGIKGVAAIGSRSLGTFAVTPPAKVAVVAPNGGERIKRGTVFNINWWAPQDAVKFNLLYTVNNGLTWIPIAQNVTGWNYLWRVPLVRSANCRIKVIGRRANGTKRGTDISNAVFRIIR